MRSVIDALIEQGTDGALYEASRLSRMYGIPGPDHRSRGYPPALMDESRWAPRSPYRSRPLPQSPDYSGFRGGPDDPYASQRPQDWDAYYQQYNRQYPVKNYP